MPTACYPHSPGKSLERGVYVMLMTVLVGPIFTIFTPFTAVGDIDIKSLQGYIQFLAENGGRQFYMMPYNGRYSQLNDDEIFRLHEICIREVKNIGGATIIVSDPIHASTERKREFAQAAFAQGADYFSSLVREKYYCNEQIVSHYSSMASVGIPIMAHAMPFLSGYNGRSMDWPEELFADLRDVEGVVAIKEDSKIANFARGLIETHGDRFDVVVAGRKRFLVEVLGRQHHSYINGVSMLDPNIAWKFWDLLAGPRDPLNDFVASVDDPFWDTLVSRYGWHRVNKASLEAAGLMNRRERRPMPELTDSEFPAVEKAVDSIRKNFASWNL